MKVVVKGDEMVLDLDGTSPEVDEGINSTYSYSYAYAMFGCKCLLAPELPYNDGLFRPGVQGLGVGTGKHDLGQAGQHGVLERLELVGRVDR